MVRGKKGGREKRRSREREEGEKREGGDFNLGIISMESTN